MRHPYLTRFALLAAATMAVPVIIMRVVQVVGVHAAEFLAKVYIILSPALDPVLKLAGVLSTSPYVSGIYGIFLLLYLHALANSLQGMRLRLRQNELLTSILGAARLATQKRWLGLMALSVIGAAGISLSPAIEVTGLETLLVNCGRLAAFVGLSATALLSALFSWQHYILNKKAALEARDTQLQHPIYVAFAAELIHAIGTNDRIPLAYELELTLSQLRELASQSHNDQFDHEDLGSLSEKALSLFLKGELETLPDLFSAKKLYYRADPAALFDIAAELQQRIEEPEVQAEEPQLPGLTLIKDSDTSLA